MNTYIEYFLNKFDTPLQNPVLVFSLILFIILVSPILLRRFNIPGIIVLIISGVIIGPNGFNLIAQNSAVELFSTIGLLYIMFIAGLDLDLGDFRANRYKSLLFGVFTFAIPLAIGYPVCFYFLGYNSDPSLLIASMFATHTLIAYPIVSKLGVSKNQAVAITVGGTILTDTAVLIMLSVIVGNHQGSLDYTFWIRFGISLALLLLIMFKIVPLLTKWFFQKLESEKHSHYIFVLAVLFFAAFMAEVAGLEPIIGAFIAGLSLNKLIPQSSALMNRIEFIGNALFIPFFLISVGMIVDVSVITHGYTALLVAGTLTLVAIAGKWLAALFTQLAFRYSRIQRSLIFGLSSSHAAATLAIIMVGHRAGMIDDNVLNGTVILILVTCIVASMVTEKAARKIVLAGAETDTDESKHDANCERLVLPVPPDLNFEKLLDLAILIKNKKSTMPITVFSVLPNSKDAEHDLLPVRKKMESYIKQASASESQVQIRATMDYNIPSGIVRTAREFMADIIILGWSRHIGLIDKLMGETTDSVINNSDKMVLMCKLITAPEVVKRIVLLIPPFGEKEHGFVQWFDKVSKLAQELSLPITLFCNHRSQKDIIRMLKKEYSGLTFNFRQFDDWEDFLIVSRYIKSDDLIILASARKGSVSYINLLEQLPFKLEKHFTENNKIVIYPQRYESSLTILQGFDDLSTSTISKGLESVQKMGKNIGSIFKKEHDTPDYDEAES
ncbi:MAG: cation:proton antiporter [Prevotellaceae bacterium]|jgi:Kef-type K+ transport system membrane component KefB|nr:cation:proton antiporter [Prevotellaceae bacterium]